MTPRLLILCSNPDTQQELTTDCKQIFKYFTKFRKIIHDLSTAQYLCELLDNLFGKRLPIKCSQSLDKIQAQVAGLSVDFLKQNFYNSTIDKKQNNDCAFMLLKIFDKNCPADKSVNFCELVIGIVTNEAFLESRDNNAACPSLKHTFTSFYKFLLEYYIKSVKLLHKKTIKISYQLKIYSQYFKKQNFKDIINISGIKS